MKKLLFFSLLLFCCQVFAQKIVYTVDGNGTHIQGVDGTNPVIFDNDMTVDSPELWYVWLKANRKQLNLVGNVSTKDGHPQGISHDASFKQWTDAYNAFNSIGGKNVPAPVRGSSRTMTNGQTTWENSVGSDLIISEAKKASPSKPLVIFVGGQVTSVANAYLKDRSIRDNIIVFHVDGWGGTDYNAIDGWACQVLMDNGVKYVNWDGNLNSWYNNAGSPMYSGSNKMPGINFSTMPSNSFSNMLRENWYNQAYNQWGDIGDAPATLWFLNNSLWRNVVRKNKSNQTVTDNNFYFLLISDNNWNSYGPQLNATLVDPNSYIPVTNPPPVNQAPVVTVTNGTQFVEGPITLMANASDPDGTVSRVEFFSNGTKVGETTISPYVYNWAAAAGVYAITARATDNQGASTTSAVVNITVVTATPIPPPTGNDYEFNILSYGAKGDGVTDDTDAIQRAANAAMDKRGELIIPPAQNFYKITRTLLFERGNQFFLDVVGYGRRGFQIVYMGQSGGAAIRIIGQKGGSWRGIKVKIGDGITNAVGVDIGTGPGGSTAGFSFYDCESEVNRGVNNVAWRLGAIQTPNAGNDISQISWYSCSAWGVDGNGVNGSYTSGQVGFLNVGNNTLQLSWFGGGTTFIDTGVKTTAGGSQYFYGMGGSHNRLQFHISSANVFKCYGGRFEFGQKFLLVEGSSNHPLMSIEASMLQDFVPPDGIIFEHRAPGTLSIRDVIISATQDGRECGPSMVKLSSPEGRGGTFRWESGAVWSKTGNEFPVSSDGSWKVVVSNVSKIENKYGQSRQFFNNK